MYKVGFVMVTALLSCIGCAFASGHDGNHFGVNSEAVTNLALVQRNFYIAYSHQPIPEAPVAYRLTIEHQGLSREWLRSVFAENVLKFKAAGKIDTSEFRELLSLEIQLDGRVLKIISNGCSLFTAGFEYERKLLQAERLKLAMWPDNETTRAIDSQFFGWCDAD